jgi:hypothetical protein
MIRPIACALFGLFSIYVMGAFIAWDFDASNWPTEGRAVSAFLGFLASVHLAVFGAMFK